MPEVSHIESDLYCIRCGHNLRTLAWEGKCSECGTPAERSRVPEWLAVNDLRSLRGIRMALVLLVMWIIIDRVTASLDITLLLWLIKNVTGDIATAATILYWPSILLCLAMLIMLRAAASDIGHRRYLVTLSLACWGLTLVSRLIFEGYLRLTDAAPTASEILGSIWKPAHIAAGAAHPLILVFVWGWLMGLFESRGRRFDRRAMQIGLFAAAIPLAPTWVEVLGVFQNGEVLSSYRFAYHRGLDVASIVVIFALIILRRRIPIVASSA